MIKYKVLTNIGNREKNEDSVGILENDGMYCFVLADGLGGHGKGEVASQTVVEEILTYFDNNGNDEEFIANAIQNAQDSILEEQKNDRKLSDMKTTVVVLTIQDGIARCGYVGDSRLYHFRKNKLAYRTLDHSVPQMLVAAKEIKEKDIRNHSDRNRLLRVIGMNWETPKYELATAISIDDKKKHAFLMCSDGFWELIDEKNMIACLKKSTSVEEWIDLMEQEIVINGKDTNMDNYSAIGVFIDGD